MMKSEVKIESGSLQIVRVFGAPRTRVFRWWAEAERLRQWSGCKEARNCEVEMDFRVGGTFTQRMEISGKGQFTVTGTYEEILEPERIVYRANLGPVATRVTVEFLVEGHGTKVVLTQDGLPDEMMRNIVAMGTTESLDKLEALIGVPAAAERV